MRRDWLWVMLFVVAMAALLIVRLYVSIWQWSGARLWDVGRVLQTDNIVRFLCLLLLCLIGLGVFVALRRYARSHSKPRSDKRR